jgi:serine/threonine-protein kinase
MEISGKAVGRYEIQEHIGSGAMAEVYKTYDPEIGRVGAIKILKDSLLEETEYLDRFLKEARAAGTLTHPNIVTIYDIGKLEQAPYIVMELLEGENLADLIKRGEQLPLESILEIAMQLASALDYAHAAGVVHRDVKPDNIIFTNNNDVVKIADFGIAKNTDTDIKDSTQAGTIMGTPRYMSPEQAKGDAVDGRSDLFALGVILYEMVTGHKAFDGKSMPTLIMQIIQKEPTPIREYSPDVPAGLQSIISRLMQKRPEKRFQTGKQLYDALAKELRAFLDKKDEKNYLPMQVRTTGIMSAVVALVMIVSATFVFNVQSKLLTDQAINAGVSLATFIASESAIALLGEDWVGLESLTDEAFKRATFDSLSIIDHTSTVRSSTDKEQIGNKWQEQANTTLLSTRRDAEIFEIDNDDYKAYAFVAPIRFNDTNIGEIRLGLSQTQLNEVMSVTKRVMVILALSVVLAVLVTLYFVNRLIARNLLTIRRSLRDLGDGNYSSRISQPWKNEFGSLALAFNALADKLQHQDLPEFQQDDSASLEQANNIPPSADLAKDAPAADQDFGDFTVIESPTDDI